MKLREWAEREGTGVLSRLQRETGLAYTTVFEVVHGQRKPQWETAKKLSAATRGEVSAEEIMEADCAESDVKSDSTPPPSS